ncbi:hypothetical protein ASE25_11255 [Terrabacter sp. Root85]|uniref:Uncharacterized protein n=1 Tax=Terrabacter terrae TaxID=318434 RepID=A0ABP5FL94_9MICO|nr:hypothetical protein [Terrabacter sp. Root85]KRC90061.1 hypothetical protein ASE25_11255 [Terrabacter sp. Root85]
MPTDDKLPYEVAGKTVFVTPGMLERLSSPDGWASLTVEELAEVGILPGMSPVEEEPPRGEFRPAK